MYCTMAGNLFLEHVVSDISHTFFSGPQPSGNTLINSDRPHSGLLIGIIQILRHGGYNIVHYIIGPGLESISPEVCAVPFKLAVTGNH